MRHLISLTACLALAVAAGALAWLVDDSAQSWASLPPLVVLALLAFAIQWLAFVPAFAAQTEHYYDLTGSATYASVVVLALLLGPAHPRGIAWNGAGGWLIFSQARQVNFSRTVWITFHCRGITSRVSVTSSPSRLSFSEPQQGQAFGFGGIQQPVRRAR